jgi:hypothetical protein
MKPKDGCSNDFGAYPLETKLLKTFLGANDLNDKQTKLCIDVTLHPRKPSESEEPKVAVMQPSNQMPPFYDFWGQFHDKGMTSENFVHPEMVRVGKVIVPLLQRLE